MTADDQADQWLPAIAFETFGLSAGTMWKAGQAGRIAWRFNARQTRRLYSVASVRREWPHYFQSPLERTKRNEIPF